MHPSLIVGLVLAALLYAVAGYIYRRKGMRSKTWYLFIGACIVVLLGFALLGFFGFLSQGAAATTVTIVAAMGIVTALRWRPSLVQMREP